MFDGCSVDWRSGKLPSAILTSQREQAMSNTEHVATGSQRTIGLFQRVANWFAGQAALEPRDADAIAIEVSQIPDKETRVTVDIPQDEKIAVLRSMSDDEFLRIVAIVARAYGVSVCHTTVEDDAENVGFGRLVLLDRIGGLVRLADQHVAPKVDPAVTEKEVARLRRDALDQADEILTAAKHLGRAMQALNNANGGAHHRFEKGYGKLASASDDYRYEIDE
jgi:hypothetical protein